MRLELELGEAREARGEIETGRLTCRGARHEYPIVRFVPRFVPAENYAANFGFQWLRFSRTQLDSHSGTTITRDRFFAQSGWSAAEMKDRRVLDVGCGAGRFAEIAVSTGARLVAVDYSSAVDACFANLGPAPNLDVVQASVYELPFRREQFDFVYCFGVLQHTPDVKASFVSLAPQVRPGAGWRWTSTRAGCSPGSASPATGCARSPRAWSRSGCSRRWSGGCPPCWR